MTMKIQDGQTLRDATPEEEGEILAFQQAASQPSIADYQSAIQGLVDQTAQEKQFNDGVTLASYKDSTNPLWAAQASAMIAWRDSVWTYTYAQLAAVQAGTRLQPSVKDFLAELPQIHWPAEV